MLAAIRPLNEARAADGAAPLRIGVGLNTGIVSVGTIGGPTHLENTVLGDAVNLSSRLESATKTYHTPLVIGESTLYGLADARRYAIRFLDRILVKGKRHPESVYEVFDGDAPDLRRGKLRTRKAFEEAAAYYHVKAIPRAIPLFEQCLASVPDDVPARLYLTRCHEFLATGRHEGTGELDGTLAWSDAFLLGYDVIDGQHRELLGLISRLGEQVRKCDPGGRSDALRFLADYAMEHFAFEEALMTRHAYPLRAEHFHAHRVFGRYFRELQGELDEGSHDPLYLAFRVQVFLVDWFVNHTTKTDRHLARFLKQQR
jgi:hemerythrin